jgi:hypothetical protein
MFGSSEIAKVVRQLVIKKGNRTRGNIVDNERLKYNEELLVDCLLTQLISLDGCYSVWCVFFMPKQMRCQMTWYATRRTWNDMKFLSALAIHSFLLFWGFCGDHSFSRNLGVTRSVRLLHHLPTFPLNTFWPRDRLCFLIFIL